MKETKARGVQLAEQLARLTRRAAVPATVDFLKMSHVVDIDFPVDTEKKNALAQQLVRDTLAIEVFPQALIVATRRQKRYAFIIKNTVVGALQGRVTALAEDISSGREHDVAEAEEMYPMIDPSAEEHWKELCKAIEEGSSAAIWEVLSKVLFLSVEELVNTKLPTSPPRNYAIRGRKIAIKRDIC